MKDRERSEKKIIKSTAEREIKKPTPAREPSRDTREPREPTPREKPLKEVKVEEKRETKERDEPDHAKKRDKDKERRREKRPTSPPAADTFEGDLSSVSNSSNGSIHPSADLVIVDDQRGKYARKRFAKTLSLCTYFITETKRRKIEMPSSKVSITV